MPPNPADEPDVGSGEEESDSAEVGFPAVPELDRVIALGSPSLADYLEAASAYVLKGRELPTRGNRESRSAKAAQGELSKVLGLVLAPDLAKRHRDLVVSELGEDVLKGSKRDRPHLLDAEAGETRVAGGLRTVRSDVTEAHHLDGVRLAVEIKPSYRAIGRAIWNRYGDVRAFAVNIHLKFPFAVVGGVQVLPTIDVEDDGSWSYPRKYLERASRRHDRIRPRVSEADADHLVEALGLLIFNPETGELDPELPPAGSRLRWDGFVSALTEAYDVRFGAEAD